MAAARWPEQTGALKVRMGLTTEEAVPRDGQYDSQLLNRCARLAAAAHGGQIVMSGATGALVRSGLRELSAALGYYSAIDLVWATAIASLTHDRAGALELGRHAIRGLRRGGDRLRMAIILHVVADALAETRPASAAIVHGAADAYAVAPPNPAGPISPTAQAALGEDRERELRVHGANMEWDQAVAYALTQVTQVLDPLRRQQ